MKPNQILSKFCLYIVFLLSAFPSFAQDLYDHELNERKWENLRESIKYEKEEEETDNTELNQEPGEKIDKEKTKTYTPISKTNNLGGLNWLGWGFAFLIGAAIIGFIIYIILNNDNSSVKPVNLDDYFENTPPAEIPLTELEKRLLEALEQRDYRGAVRIYYIFILKDISLKQWINWEKDKTNMHYLREMSGKPEFDDFHKAISYFELIWYGKRQIDQTKFEIIQPYYTNLLQKLGVK